MNFRHGDQYEGMWANNVADGKGILWYANGDTYKGQFKDDVPNGIGELFH